MVLWCERVQEIHSDLPQKSKNHSDITGQSQRKVYWRHVQSQELINVEASVWLNWALWSLQVGRGLHLTTQSPPNSGDKDTLFPREDTSLADPEEIATIKLFTLHSASVKLVRKAPPQFLPYLVVSPYFPYPTLHVLNK